ncbi:MAG TPA: asparaginase domain-containing protein [Thermoanaerobaculia bacterium]|jgi:L-asparaginase/Glu-tRNA(Gln) amidotransferase subunit D/predicted Ser/Thr protein kinase|nr:asparaginase domain-containing protein [Thermoanaerobaculia bacterium]
MREFPDSLVGARFENWLLERKLGEGASAAVFFATRGKTHAAVKIYRPELIRRAGEAEQLARISRQKQNIPEHPSLVPILDGGRARNGLLYLVMEFVEGNSLDQVASSVPVERIAPLLSQIADAAHALEAHGIVHRDIKPANIIVGNDFRNARLLDFGVIKRIADPQGGLTDASSHAGAFLGTWQYSPPEFLRREEHDDIDGWRAVTFYQLGAVAFDMLTRKPLFAEHANAAWPTFGDVVATAEPDLAPANLRAGVPEYLVELARTCLAKKPEDRRVKWGEFECKRFVRRPVVVLVYTGGTIGATVEGDNDKVRVLRPVDSTDSPLLKAFEERLIRDYGQLAGPGSPLAVDLVWEFLPHDQQILSENAHYKTWIALSEAVKRICDHYARGGVSPDTASDYLAGIILLHGTDTLSYSAAALALSLRNLPCPVVLTGSNQPPNENNITERDLIESESDAWKNVLLSLQFIQAFGHRFTEVFVCFGDTVHVAVNLRKDPIDRSPQPFPRRQKAIQEPYFYRNRGPMRQYAYRVIDGLYCNNLYPMGPDLSYDVLLGDSTNEHRHIRRTPWAPSQPLACAAFGPGVGLLPASPAPVLPTDLRVIYDGEPTDCRVILIEGYNSGTIPTAEGHPYRDFLTDLLRKSIPVVLVTRNGLVPSSQPYEMSRIDDVALPIVRMFGVVAETAVPLLSLALARITPDDWDARSHVPALNNVALLDHRIAKLGDAIRKTQSETGILKALLGDVLDQEKQREKITEEISRRENDHLRRATELFSQTEDAKVRPGRKPFYAGRTILQRQHFLWLLGELVYMFEASNSGPDGLTFWNELGFNWGEQVRDTVWRNARELDLSPKRAKAQTELITQFLKEHGVADVRARLELKFASEHETYRDGHITVTVNARKYGGGARQDDLLTAVGYRDDEAAFLKRLREGAPLTQFTAEAKQQIEREYRALFDHTLRYRVSPLDWFLVGTYKALVSGLLRDFRFDPWVVRCSRDDPRHREILRRSISIDLSRADRETFDFRLQYVGRIDATRDWNEPSTAMGEVGTETD